MNWPLLSALILFGRALAHSWNEQITVVENGMFTGNNGYPRGYISRSTPGFSDTMMSYILPPLDSERERIDDTDLLCAPSQRSLNQTYNFPRLQVYPGAYIAIRYLENGHVTLPQNTPGKPQGSGTIYVFGTDQPNNNELLTQVLHWTADGTGGDKRGKLLAAQNFDDGRCYQINSGEISTARQEKYPNPIPGQPGSVHEQWCETEVAIPTNLLTDSTYTLYWVWQWPTLPGTPNVPNGKDEYYTTCSDLDVVAGPIPKGVQNPLPIQDPQISAVPNFESRKAYKPSPLP